MREILFRGERKDNGEWVYGDLLQDKDLDVCMIEFFEYYSSDTGLERDYQQHMIIPETIGQYTGLIDKNGKKIFEGDIVTMPSYYGGKHKAVVYFEQGKFAVDGSNRLFKDICPRNMEVIGNIHDSPELLGGTDNGE